MKKTKILFDISHGVHGSTGIQQDMRRILSFLIREENFQIDFLVYDMVNNVNYINFDIKKNLHKYGEIVSQSRLLSYFFNPVGESLFGNGRFFGRVKKWNYKRSLVNKDKVEFLKINKRFNELIYKKLLKDGGSIEVLEKFKNANVLMSTFSTESLILGMMNEDYKIPTLNTKEYDLAIFFQEIPFKISSNTKKIVRTYDLIQILGPDVVFKADYKSNYQYKSINACIKQKTNFSTISDTVKNQLHQIFEDEVIASTIYVPISDVFKKTDDKFSISDYVKTYLIRDSKFNDSVPEIDFDYFLSVSTIEPRKNIVTSYQAFKQLKMRGEYKSLKFILVGKVGWNLDNTYKNMFKDPEVIVLENVPTVDLPYLYSNAKALIYIPFQEGFGVPPAEAMACGCPVVLSDIPVHREIHGETPLFVNHYDVNGVYQAMKWLMDNDNCRKLTQLKKKGLSYIDKFKAEVLRKEWISFINNVLKG